jgi:hypothetical protein
MIVILLPIVLGLPAMILPVPPLAILIPASLPFGIQIPPPVLGLTAVVAAFLDGSIQSCFCLFDRVLALTSVVGTQPRFCYKEQKGARQEGGYGCITKSSNQGSLLPVFN